MQGRVQGDAVQGLEKLFFHDCLLCEIFSLLIPFGFMMLFVLFLVKNGFTTS